MEDSIANAADAEIRSASRVRSRFPKPDLVSCIGIDIVSGIVNRQSGIDCGVHFETRAEASRNPKNCGTVSVRLVKRGAARVARAPGIPAISIVADLTTVDEAVPTTG